MKLYRTTALASALLVTSACGGGSVGDTEMGTDGAEAGEGTETETSSDDGATGDGDTGDGDGTTVGDGDGDGDGDGTSSGDGDGTSSGDGDGTSGDGDGTSGDGDGTSGDGDGSSGDGDGTSGDGDGSSGDGDGTSGDGDGASGDGDGSSGDGDGTSGDGDGTSGDGDGTTGDGDGTTGDGDGSTGDGDGTTGDGDGSTGDGDGSTGDGDGSTGDGDGSTGDGDGSTGDGTTGDGDGTTGDGDGTTGDGDGTVPCLMTQPTVTFEPPNLVMVLDKSGSMLEPFSGSTRWNTLVNVVQNVTMSWESRIKFGAKVFPTADACVGGSTFDCSGSPCLGFGDTCEVAAGFDDANLAPALNNSANIVSALPTAAELDAGCWTPTDFGFLRSYEALTAVAGTEPAAIMLVIDGLISDGTGGSPNLLCQGPQLGAMVDSTQGRLTNGLSTALTAGVPTYVVAIDAVGAGSVADANLYAQLGGRPNPDPTVDYYPGDDLTELQNAMDAIAAEVASCEVDLGTTEPPNPDDIKVFVQGSEYFQITETECGNGDDGWYYSIEFTELTLCGVACDDFKAMTTPTADVEYYCSAG